MVFLRLCLGLVEISFYLRYVRVLFLANNCFICLIHFKWECTFYYCFLLHLLIWCVKLWWLPIINPSVKFYSRLDIETICQREVCQKSPLTWSQLHLTKTQDILAHKQWCGFFFKIYAWLIKINCLGRKVKILWAGWLRQVILIPPRQIQWFGGEICQARQINHPDCSLLAESIIRLHLTSALWYQCD